MSSSENDTETRHTSGDHGTEANWDQLKRARNRINSQRTRERERVQIDNLEGEKARLFISNEGIRFHNKHMREAIQKIREIQADPASLQRRQSRLGAASAAAPSAPLASSMNTQQNQSLPNQQVALQQMSSPIGQLPPNLAGIMMGSENGAGAALSAQQSTLNAMASRQLGGMNVLNSSRLHPFLLTSVPIPASQLPGAPGSMAEAADIALLSAGGHQGLGQFISSDGISSAGMAAFEGGSGATDELKIEMLESLRKRRRTHM